MINYQEILIFKNYLNFTYIDVYDYSTYNFNDEDKPNINNFVLWNIEFKKNQCKDEAKRRIKEYDWITDDATTPQLINKSDFYAYRSALRELILNPVENPVWPEIPQEEWDAE